MSDTSQTCGCCEGVEPVTPEPTANRPGLDALRYRIGTHATFLETMIARLGTMTIPAEMPPPLPTADGRRSTADVATADEVEASGDVAGVGAAVHPAAGSAPPAALAATPIAPLRALTTRRPDDPSIALLDAFAVVGDVLTFYQERFANEGYLRPATERLSVMNLARLVGYRARPGLSASVYLSFTLEDSFTEETTIPAGTKAQSQPAGEEEKAQVFETAEAITARASWNRIRPRQSRPQNLSVQPENLYVAGVGLNLRRGDRLLVERPGQDPVLWRVEEAIEDRAANRTRIVLPVVTPTATPSAVAALPGGSGALAGLLRALVTALNALDDGEMEALEAAQGQLVEALLLTMDALTDPDGGGEVAAGVALQELTTLLDALLDDDLSAGQSRAVGLMQRLTLALAALLAGGAPPTQGDPIQALAGQLAAPISAAAIPPATPYHLALDTAATFNATSDLRLRLLATTLGGTTLGRTKLLADLYKGARVFGLGSDGGPPAEETAIFVVRATAAPFGHNAPLIADIPDDGGQVTYAEWAIDDPHNNGASSIPLDPPLGAIAIQIANPARHHPSTLYLDAEYDIPTGSRVIIERAGERVLSYAPTADQIDNETLAAYGISGKSTRLDLGAATWFSGNDFSNVRTTRVYLATERLTPAEEPIVASVPAESTPNTIQLNGVYEGLAPGRWVVVSGERADLDGVTGVMASELVMIRNAAIVSDNGGPRTELTFANELAYRYKRDTAVLLANTVRATHGETVSEVLGSGDARRRWPAFDLRKPPLTYLPAPTPAGAESTLTVRVNDVRWREADNHVLLGPADRAYVLERREEKEFDATTVIFGDGQNGARLPTGVENVTAVYRSGLGQPGNVPAGRIKQLATRPLGVKDVINALPATGGADREGRDSTRANAPLAVMALDRLVSVQDYADFARTFAGIGKAAAAELSDGRRSVVHLTIAGADDIPIDTTSDLYRNLRLALARAGDPWTPVQIALRELILLVVIAGVRLHPDYLWSAVAPQIRARLYDRLSFGRRDLGQDVTAGEIIAAIHTVPGVVYADLDLLDGLTGADVAGPNLAERLVGLAKAAATPNARPLSRIKAEMARPDRTDPTVLQPAQLAILDPRLPETLILKELT